MLRDWKFEIELSKHSGKPVYLQIADAITNDIHSGRLKAGDALPGSRNFAQTLKVNRNTVVEALNVLLNEGWLISKERKGTFVADILPSKNLNIKNVKSDEVYDLKNKNHFRIQFDDGYPDSKIAPIEELARAYRQIFNRKAKWQMMGYGDELGDIEFRKTIAQMLNHQRAMQAQENQICITRGSQMAMYLTAQCLVKEGDFVMVENPGYKPAWKTFENAGAELLPVNIDKEGLIIEDVIHYLKKNNRIKAIYITPHRQYPTTVTLSLKRRLELIKLSNEYDFTIVEDDYDNEFHFGYRPILPLSSLPELKNYVYIGTLSKVVAPALRIGYLVCSDYSFIEKIGDLRKIIDVQGDNIMEQAVLQLIKDGTIKRHIKKATNYYKSKRDFVAELLHRYLKKTTDYDIPEGGLAFWISPKKEVDWSDISEHLQSKGIKIISPDSYSFDKSVNGIRLGYGSLSEKDLEESIIVLSQFLQ